MTQQYQIAVIGTQVAGLLAALKLSLAGQRVLVVADDGDQSGTLLSGYWCADDSAFTALPDDADLKQFFRTLPIDKNDEELATWQLLLPNRRLNITSDYGAELSHSFGQEALKAIEKSAASFKEESALLNKTLFHSEKNLFPQGLMGRLKYGFKSKELAALPPARRAADVPEKWPLLSRFLLALDSATALGSEDDFPLGTAMPLSVSLALENHKHFKEGRTLRETLLAHFRSIGGEVKSAKLKAINNKGRLLTSLVLEPKNEEISFECAILAGESYNMHGYLASSSAQKKLAKEEALIKPEMALYRRQYLVKSAVRPEGMANRAIYFFKEAHRAQVLPFMAIELRHPSKLLKETAALASPDETVIQLTATLFIACKSLQESGVVEELDRAIFKALEETIPFFNDFLIDRETGEPRVQTAPRFTRAAELKAQLVGLPIDTPFPNVFRAQNSVLPTLGIAGEWQCANIVVSRALQYFRR